MRPQSLLLARPSITVASLFDARLTALWFTALVCGSWHFLCALQDVVHVTRLWSVARNVWYREGCGLWLTSMGFGWEFYEVFLMVHGCRIVARASINSSQLVVVCAVADRSRFTARI